jgi:serine/threonine protein kinase
VGEVSEETRSELRRVLQEAVTLELIPPSSRLETALRSRDSEHLLANLRDCDLPRSVWAAVQGAWREEVAVARSPRGLRLAGYELLEELGRGGMATVHRARDPAGLEVALKVCSGVGPHSLRRFQRECEQLTHLEHPNIVRCLRTGSGPPPWLAMELVLGGDLDERLERGPLAIDEATWLVAALADAVAYAHAQGVVHRDLKPSNVLLRREDAQPLLTDFGLVVATDASRFTLTGCLLGTPTYMAPEQAVGRGADDPALDVWGLGGILYHCLTGQPAMQADTLLQLLALLRDPRISPPGSLRPEVPPWLSRLCMRCLTKEASARPTARELAEDLRRGRPGSAPLERRRGWATASLALLGVLGVASAGALLGSREPPASRQSARSGPSAPAEAPPWPTDPALSVVWEAHEADWDLPSGGGWERNRVDPLSLEAWPEVFSGPARGIGNGRVEVDYPVTPEQLTPFVYRPDRSLLEGRYPLVRATETGAGIRFADLGYALVGRGIWRGLRARVEVEVDPGRSGRVLVGVPPEEPPMLPTRRLDFRWQADLRGVPFYVQPTEGYAGSTRWAPFPPHVRAATFEVEPGAEGARARCNGVDLQGLGEELASPAPDGTLAVGGPLTSLRAVRLTGVPLRPDRLAFRELPQAAGLRSRLEASFRREPSELRSGGPFLALGDLRVELRNSELQLLVRWPGRPERVLARARLSQTPRRGWLLLDLRDGLARAELWRAGERVAQVACAHPSLSDHPTARVGSAAEVVRFHAARLSLETRPPHRAVLAWRKATREGLQRCAPPPFHAAPPWDARRCLELVEELTTCSRSEDVPPQVRLDALIRAAQLAVLAGDEPRARTLGQELAPQLGGLDLRVALANTGLPATQDLLERGLGAERALGARAAGHALLRALLQTRGRDWAANLRGEVGLWMLRGQSTRDPARADQSYQIAWQLAEEANALGFRSPEQDGELLNLMQRYAEAARLLEACPPDLNNWWPFYQRFAARSATGRREDGEEDLIAALARRPAGPPRKQLARLILGGSKFSPVRRALYAQLLRWAAGDLAPGSPPDGSARNERERALASYLAVVLGANRSLPRGDDPVTLLARARAGQADALQALPAACASDLLVDAIVRLDPYLRFKVPRRWR